MRVVGAFLLTLAVIDACVSLFVLRDGMLAGIPLPPFSSITHPKQRLWIAELGKEKTESIGRFDAELGWTWRPSAIDSNGVTINALGARGPREYAKEKPAGTTRAITFGDSFTFGDEIGDDKTFQRIYEGRHRDFEMINFGVSGYGTDQALVRYRRLGRDLDADVVCIGIMLENIGRNVNRFRPLWNTRTGFCATKPRFVLRGDALELLPQPFDTRESLLAALEDDSVFDHITTDEYWWKRPAVPTGRISSLVRIAAGFLGERARSPERLWRDQDGEPFRTTLAILETFQTEALANGARFAPILIFPAPKDLYEHALPSDEYWQALLGELERRGMDVINPIPALAARELELRAAPGQGSLYFKSHLTSVGNSVVADEIHRWLEARL